MLSCYPKMFCVCVDGNGSRIWNRCGQCVDDCVPQGVLCCFINFALRHSIFPRLTRLAKMCQASSLVATLLFSACTVHSGLLCTFATDSNSVHYSLAGVFNVGCVVAFASIRPSRKVVKHSRCRPVLILLLIGLGRTRACPCRHPTFLRGGESAQSN